MKILGHTPKGDLIIQVTPAEWDGLQKGQRPQDDEWWVRWKKTDTFNLFKSNGLRGKGAFSHLYKDGAFDGSLEQLRKLIDDQETRLANIGPDTRQKIRQALDELEAKR